MATKRSTAARSRTGSRGRSRVAVTGAFGFTGRAIAERLLEAGHDVVTLTRRSGAGDPMTQRLTVVAQAEPTAPRPGMPRWP